ncbi:ABC transporter permease [Legionella londiniensis]|uniref:ABC transporter permease n=1 Tax=Legionella londiniensis TaxID=45068 RepID=A0A0W0VI57_9GAMM|nr:ABC transporter permease [Legionella londiniensis]KTD19794.1 ABC transporter permease [Legionella londiniensis]STX92295.1 ABC transporter permease [Legionella londiniensis]
MKPYHLCQQALINLMAAKLRSFLAVLGILVGTAAIVALLSCGRLATEKALAQFKALGTDLLAVSVYQQSNNAGLGGQDKISVETWRELPEQIDGILQIAPYGTAYQQMSFQGKTIEGAIVAADESLAKIIKIELVAGHFVSFVDSFEHFCVIGAGLAEQLKQISLENPIGKQLHLGQTLYTIIGIAKPWKENSFFNEDINQAVIIPISGLAMVNKDAKINNAVMLIKPEANIDKVTAGIRQHLNRQAPKLGIFVRSAKQIIASMENQGQIFTLLLAVIGSISLLVGGIGIMNVMLVSVSERKKEIGIRKAVGAKNRDIQMLFLAEAVILSMLGGISGVIVGLFITWIIACFSHWPFTIFFLPLYCGFLVSVASGIFFGFYPARRAALLEPIVSLRAGV